MNCGTCGQPIPYGAPGCQNRACPMFSAPTAYPQSTFGHSGLAQQTFAPTGFQPQPYYAGPPYGTVAPTRPPTGIRTVGNIAAVLIIFTGAAYAIFIWALAVTPDKASGGAPTDIALIGVSAMLVMLVGYLAGFVFFLIWLYRARRNLDGAPEAASRWTPGWAVGGWLIPLANVVIGPLVTADVGRNSLPPADVAGRRAIGVLAVLWAICWPLGGALMFVGFGVADVGGINAAAIIFLTLGSLAVFLAVVGVVAIIRRTVQAQETRFGL